jgi:hypothetical protein
VENISQTIDQYGVKLLVVDSLAQAAGGNINEAEPAIAFYQALGSLGIASLLVGQQSKDTFGKNKTVFGSTMFEYYASSVWEIHKGQDEDSPEATISLVHKKHNLSGKHSPIFYKVTFNNNDVRFELTDPKNTELSDQLPLAKRIEDILLEGAKSSKDIASTLGEPENQVRGKLARFKGKKFVKLENNLWGAIHA